MKTSLMICVSLIVLMFVGAGCYEVVYTAEYKGDSCIKFEDAITEVEPDVWVEDCLGEDGAVEADAFYAELEGDPDPEDIEVTIKAGKCKDTIEGLVWSDDYETYVGEACGFIVGLLEIVDDTYVFGVLSDDIEGGKGGTAALSNVTFCFGDAIVISPEEGEFLTYRAEEEEIYPEI